MARKFKFFLHQWLMRVNVMVLVVNVLLSPCWAGKEKKQVRKKNVPVTDPLCLRTIDDWINLGKESLVLSCNAAGILPSSSITHMARSLYGFYQALRSSATITTDTGKIVLYCRMCRTLILEL